MVCLKSLVFPVFLGQHRDFCMGFVIYPKSFSQYSQAVKRGCVNLFICCFSDIIEVFTFSQVFIHKVFHSLCITYPGEFLRFFLSCCQSGSSEVFAALVFSLVSSV